jgi:hypothetical protein
MQGDMLLTLGFFSSFLEEMFGVRSCTPLAFKLVGVQEWEFVV